MGHAEQFTNRGDWDPYIIGERRNAHGVVLGTVISMPSPVQDRQLTTRTLWEKLDDNTYFLAEKTCVHERRTLEADTISDTVVILDFRRTGNMHYASLLMFMIGMNLALQLMLAFVQTVGLKKSRVKCSSSRPWPLWRSLDWTPGRSREALNSRWAPL